MLCKINVSISYEIVPWMAKMMNLQKEFIQLYLQMNLSLNDLDDDGLDSRDDRHGVDSVHHVEDSEDNGHRGSSCCRGNIDLGTQVDLGIDLGIGLEIVVLDNVVLDNIVQADLGKSCPGNYCLDNSRHQKCAIHTKQNFISFIN